MDAKKPLKYKKTPKNHMVSSYSYKVSKRPFTDFELVIRLLSW